MDVHVSPERCTRWAAVHVLGFLHDAETTATSEVAQIGTLTHSEITRRVRSDVDNTSQPSSVTTSASSTIIPPQPTS